MKTKNILRFLLIMVVTGLFLSPPVFAGTPASECGSDGKIIVKDIRSTDTELGNYIRDVISGVKCPDLENAGIYDFKVIFNFKLI